MDGKTLEDAFKSGVAIAASLLLLVYVIRLQHASTPEQMVDIFGSTFYAFVVAIFPTSEFALVLDFCMGTMGASLAVSKLRAEIVGATIGFGFFWTATNIVVGLIQAPV